MKHEIFKYQWNNCYTTPIKNNIWLRDVEDKNGDTCISECKICNYILGLHLFSHVPEPYQSLSLSNLVSRERANEIWNEHLFYGYNFDIRDLQNKCIYYCALENNMWFDTRDIDDAEQTAEYIFKLMKLE